MLLPVQGGSQSPQARHLLLLLGEQQASDGVPGSDLPALPGPHLCRPGGVQVLSLTQGCRVPSITQRQLYDHNLHNLQKIEMMHCQLRNIEENSFYYMEILQHINMR